MHGNGGRVRLRVAAQSTLGAVAVVALVLAVTHLALRLPGLRFLGGFAPAALVSYDRFLGELSPLSDDYISRVLGIDTVPSDAGPARDTVAAPPPRVMGPSSAHVPGKDVDPAPVELRHAFTNDDFANAVRAEQLPFVARTDTTTATRQPDEPSSCAPVGGTAWYAYHPDRPTTLVADTFGTSYATALAVFRGRSLSSLEQVGCSHSVIGNAAVSLRAAAGQRYWFQVTGPAGGGTLAFSLTPLGSTSRVSVTTHGRESTGFQNDIAALSPDGRYVAFTAGSEELGSRSCGELAGLHARCYALFLRDTVAGTTELLLSATPRRPNTQDAASRQATGLEKFGYMHLVPKFSADGRYLAFHSDDPTLVPGDGNGHDDVFVLDRITRDVERVSVSSSGTEGRPGRVGTSANSYGGSMSADGRYVAFTSAAEGLVRDDTNYSPDVFVRDRRTGTTERVSVRGGGQLDGPSRASLHQAISADGRYVVFASHAPSISPQSRVGPCAGDACEPHVFLHDRRTRTTRLLSHTPTGRPGNGPAEEPTISADGRVVAFTSTAADLVDDDTNEVADVFWHDVRTGRTLRASVSSTGLQQRTPPLSRGERATPSQLTRPTISLSADGRYVAFASPADNLVPGDGNQSFDVFVHDARNRSTARLSVTDSGGDGDGDSFVPFLSADGRSVVFGSSATNLVARDMNGKYDLFVHRSLVPGRA